MQADLEVMVRGAQQGEGGVEHGCAARGDAAAAPDKQGRRHAATRWRMEAQRTERGEHVQQARARVCGGCGTALFLCRKQATSLRLRARLRRFIGFARIYWVYWYYWDSVVKPENEHSSPPFPAAAAAADAALSAATAPCTPRRHAYAQLTRRCMPRDWRGRNRRRLRVLPHPKRAQARRARGEHCSRPSIQRKSRRISCARLVRRRCDAGLGALQLCAAYAVDDGLLGQRRRVWFRLQAVRRCFPALGARQPQVRV